MHAKHAIWITLALSAAANAQIYRCDGPSGPVFSQAPCAADAKVVEVQAAPLNPDAAEAARLRTEAADERHQLDLQRARHDVRLRQARDGLSSAIGQRDSELANIRRRRGHAMNNLAGATYLQSLAGEEQAVTARYAGQIQQLRDEIAELERTRP